MHLRTSGSASRRPSHLVRAVRTRVEAGGLRAALALPPRVQRRLAGRPVDLDGQRLAVDTQLMLRLKDLVREPAMESLPVPEGRTAMRHQTTLVGGRQPVGGVAELTVAGMTARLYVPRAQVGRPGPHPTLLFLHGGAWVYGDLETHDAACRVLAEGSGCRVLAVDYRLAPEHPFPAAYDDSLSAYRWLLEHADRVDADPSRLGIGGDSAGGCLAASVAIAAARESLPLAFQLLVYPATDLRGGTESRRLFAEGFFLSERFIEVGRQHYLPEPWMLDDPVASPLLAELPDDVARRLAPAYVATAGFDPLRDEGEAYARRLAAAGVEVELRRFPDQIHGFLNVVGVGRTARAAVAEIAGRLGAGLSAPAAG